jgi:hypothetical protein
LLQLADERDGHTVNDVDRPGSQGGNARRRLRDRLEYETLCRRRATPITIEGFQNELLAGREAGHFVWASAYRILCDAGLAELLQRRWRNDRA